MIMMGESIRQIWVNIVDILGKDILALPHARDRDNFLRGEILIGTLCIPADMGRLHLSDTLRLIGPSPVGVTG